MFFAIYGYPGAMPGVTRFAINPVGGRCEFAIVIAGSMRGKGLGQRPINSLMDAARSKGLKIMEGDVISSNSGMLKFMARIGFTIGTSDGRCQYLLCFGREHERKRNRPH